MAKTVYVNCPFCEGMMEINSETGEIVGKWSAAEKTKDEDKMSSALKKIEEAKKKRAGLFDSKKEELESQKKKNEDVFRKEVEKVKKEGLGEKPFRPLDLD
jgi:uncharacterized protein YpuA (DUF1002 family)